MKRRRFTKDQIAQILREYDAGRRVGDICRDYEISNTTFYRWNATQRPAGVQPSGQSDGFEEEIGEIRRQLADAMQAVLSLEAKLEET